MQYSYYIIHVYIYIYSYLDNTYIYIYDDETGATIPTK